MIKTILLRVLFVLVIVNLFTACTKQPDSTPNTSVISYSSDVFVGGND